MQNNHPKAVENYTDAFLGTLGLLLFMIFFVIASFAGIIWALITGFVLNRGITYLLRRRSR